MTRGAVALLLLFSGWPFAGSAQVRVPLPIQQRIRQALWPEIMVDSMARPTPGQILDDWRGDPRQPLSIRIDSQSELPRVQFYSTAAFRCFDCVEFPVAAVQRDTLIFTVLSPEHLAVALEVFGANIAIEDTAAVRKMSLALLRGTCILGCNPRIVEQESALSLSQRRIMRANRSDSVRSPFILPPFATVDRSQTTVGSTSQQISHCGSFRSTTPRVAGQSTRKSVAASSQVPEGSFGLTSA